MNKQKQNRALKYTVLVLIVIQLLTIVWMVTLQVTLNNRDFTNERFVNQTLNVTSELRFCIDNQIHPCNNISIEQWNVDHPNNTFKRSN